MTPTDQGGSTPFVLTFEVGAAVTVFWGGEGPALSELGPDQLAELESMLAGAQRAVRERRKIVERVGIPTPLGR